MQKANTSQNEKTANKYMCAAKNSTHSNSNSYGTANRSHSISKSLIILIMSRIGSNVSRPRDKTEPISFIIQSAKISSAQQRYTHIALRVHCHRQNGHPNHHATEKK